MKGELDHKIDEDDEIDKTMKNDFSNEDDPNTIENKGKNLL